MTEIDSNIGFDNRIFLTEAEWNTYKRRKPVRYIRKKKSELCEICEKPSEKDNPIQNSHIIGFNLGIIYLALTPEYVDNYENILSAHRKQCNSTAELSLLNSCKELKNRGVKQLPSYLPEFIHNIWNEA